MLNFFEMIPWITIFFILLAVSVVSALILLVPRIPVSYIRVHIGIIALPPIIALLALVFNNESVIIGPWHFDSLSWLWSTFVLTIGLIVQRYSVHYLFGNRAYRKYFALLTVMTIADSLAWLSDDLRLLMLGWGVTLLGLVLLIGMRKEWKVARHASKISSRYFAISWLILLIAIVWIEQVTGHWHLSQILSQESLEQFKTWEKTSINLLLLLSIFIPAAQWPFQRWLLDSVVAPTPISAVMHAGIVNAGSIMLTRFAPLFNGDSVQVVLLILSSVSVLVGTGIMLVQVDYKRQLVGSTIAQMGFMLIECALGAYLAAITHAVLHGLFKSTLFLQAGSAAKRREPIVHKRQLSSVIWMIFGGVLGLGLGIAFWLTSPTDGYQFVSAIILGWSVALAWTQLVAFGAGHIGRIVGAILFVGAAIIFQLVHTGFHSLLYGVIPSETTQSIFMGILLLSILIVASVIGIWSIRKNSKTSITIYLWLIRLGEPKGNLVESHPKYLTQLLSRGGNVH
ncbi:NADH dehydrogenase subunit 5 [Rummeliibacillus sp. POC4]|uniref:NADH dehydrogenase subunit 5 n=1 Tax=Rummeliibacillus sp. POC4 TaxID=2305899 RepID=UPI000E6625AD|nr:NADH dehydrogenase subunit 5 [Rummeliibacillus sp. POC4]RIJ68828.1 NADH dehydrogenase subunit 5 [Rummeliibacillus sp. POC4]